MVQSLPLGEGGWSCLTTRPGQSALGHLREDSVGWYWAGPRSLDRLDPRRTRGAGIQFPNMHSPRCGRLSTTRAVCILAVNRGYGLFLGFVDRDDLVEANCEDLLNWYS